jgi:tRNA-dihydrouridine synthase
LLGNGDVHSMQDVIRRVRDTGVHGVLVGRGALGSPWFFKTNDTVRALARSQYDRKQEQETSVSVAVDLEKRFAVMIEHARQFETIFGVSHFPRMRKHLGWYCKGFAHAASLRASMVRASSVVDVERILEGFLSAHPFASSDSAASPFNSEDAVSSVPLSCA